MGEGGIENNTLMQCDHHAEKRRSELWSHILIDGVVSELKLISRAWPWVVAVARL